MKKPKYHKIQNDMTLEWFYTNLTSIVIGLGLATIVLFIFPILLGRDLLKKSRQKDKK